MEENDARKEGELTEEESSQRLFAYVVAQIQNGLDDAAIERELVDMGMSRGDAAELVGAVHASLAVAAEAERPTGFSLLMALAGGAGAAILGGVIWGLIIIATGFEIGIMAWALGGLTGYAVLLFSLGKRGRFYQGIAALSAVSGIVVAKYIAYVNSIKEFIRSLGGEASEVPWFSRDVVEFFLEDITVVFSGWDIIWIALAVYTAWRIPTGLGLRRPRSGKY